MIKLHLGCGWRNFGKEWIHIDGGSYDHLNYRSVTNLSQFKDASVDVIYASHVLAYFDRESVIQVLAEWNRVLKPGGLLRIAVPNFKPLSKLYLEGKIEIEKVLGPLYGRMSMSEETIYHKTVYDFKSLKDTLLTAGFFGVKRYEWRNTDHCDFDDHSQAYIPHMDKENGTLVSLNVECSK